MEWKEAIEEVLRTANAPMHYAEIAEQVFERNLRPAPTATPPATVNSTISTSLKNEGEDSPFIRVSPGLYALRNTPIESRPSIAPNEPPSSSDVTGLVNAFGMFWDRDKVRWETDPQILGQQQPGSKPVNFCEQRGVYLLHDAQGVVYVGRAIDQNLGKRLQQHTSDRLTGRWTRFSWFGVYPVEENGALRKSADFSNVPISTVIVTMEAVLIEGLEPRQNRKRGDDFQAIEFLQVEDPQIVKDRNRALIREVAERL
jgi:hypothetical protein